MGWLARQRCQLRGIPPLRATWVASMAGGGTASSQPSSPRLGSPLCLECQQSQAGSLTPNEEHAQGWESHCLWGTQGGHPGSTPKGRAGGPLGPIPEPGLAVAAQSSAGKDNFESSVPKLSRGGRNHNHCVDFNQLMRLNPNHPGCL